MSNWITRPEAAKRLGISVCTLDRIVAEGKLPAYRMTGRASVRFREEDLAAYIESCRVPVLTPAQRRRTAAVAPPVCRYKPGDLVVYGGPCMSDKTQAGGGTLQMDPGEILRDYMASKTPVKQIKILAELNCCESQDIVRILREQGAPIPKIYDPKPKREPMAPQEPGTAKKTPTHALTVGVLQQILGHVPGDTPIQVLGNGVANYVTFLERYEAGTGESRYVLELGREERP